MPVLRPGLGSTTSELRSYAPCPGRSTAGREPGEGRAGRHKEKLWIKISQAGHQQKQLQEVFNWHEVNKFLKKSYWRLSTIMHAGMTNFLDSKYALS